MGNDPNDPRWSKLLSLAVHEFRTPITVVAGYIRMVLRERAGPISDAQRKLLEEAEKSCSKLSALVAEMSDLSRLEEGTETVNRSTFDLADVLRDVVATIPELPDRSVAVALEGAGHPVPLAGDAARLRSALASLVTALRREIVTSDRLIVRHVASPKMARLAIGDPDRIDGVAAADPSTMERFNEWRGGSGLSLAIARRVIAQHGGSLFSPPGDEGKAAALVLFRRS
jgi:signal transduction histidine kinase